MKVLFCILTWISLLSGMGPGSPVAASPEKKLEKELEEQVAAHLQAAAILNVYAIHTTIRLLDLLEAEYDNGATNVGPEFWEREVIARCDSVTAYLNDAVQYIESVLPEKIRDPFWTDIYYCQDSMAGMCRRWESLGSIYCSEFQTIMTGAQNHLHSYLIIFGARLMEMDDVVERYSRLLDEGPEAREHRAKEEAAQEKMEKALKRRVRMAGSMKSLGTAPKSMYPGDGKVQFMGIPLGTGYDRFVKELKAAGFSLKLKRDENHSFYGMCHEGFFTGSIDGIPVSVRLTTSSLTRSVFEIEVNYRNFIDQDEAIEECDRILARERNVYPHTAVDVDQALRQIIQDADASPTPKMLDLLSNGGKQVVKEMCFMKSELLMHLFDERPREDRLNSFGSISFGVYELSLGQEHIVRARYFDRAVGEAAEKEAKQGRQR